MGRVIRTFPLLIPIFQAQLTFKQQRFELYRSTYIQLFFSGKLYVTYTIRGWLNLQTGRADS